MLLWQQHALSSAFCPSVTAIEALLMNFML